jgi:hypothetical protein
MVLNNEEEYVYNLDYHLEDISLFSDIEQYVSDIYNHEIYFQEYISSRIFAFFFHQYHHLMFLLNLKIKTNK